MLPLRRSEAATRRRAPPRRLRSRRNRYRLGPAIAGPLQRRSPRGRDKREKGLQISRCAARVPREAEGPHVSRTVDLLAIAAHRDDVEQTCGGVLIRMAEKGYRTGIL